MMNQETTYLKQAKARITAQGILSEKNLELVRENNETTIRGTITVKTSDINFITFRIQTREFNKDGNVSKSYENILPFMKRAKSIAEVGEQEASRVSITSGQLNPYTAFNEAGGKFHGLSYKTGFVTIIDPSVCEPHCHFEVECFVKGVEDESDKETQVPTGRVILHTLLPIYNNGIENLDIVVPSEFAVAAKTLYTTPGNESAHIWGDIVSTVKVQQQVTECLIGGKIVEDKKDRENELVLTHGNILANPYELETIQRAVAEYDLVLEGKRNERMNNRKGSGAGRGFGNIASTMSSPKASGSQKGAPNGGLGW